MFWVAEAVALGKKIFFFEEYGRKMIEILFFFWKRESNELYWFLKEQAWRNMEVLSHRKTSFNSLASPGQPITRAQSLSSYVMPKIEKPQTGRKKQENNWKWFFVRYNDRSTCNKDKEQQALTKSNKEEDTRKRVIKEWDMIRSLHLLILLCLLIAFSGTKCQS